MTTFKINHFLFLVLVLLGISFSACEQEEVAVPEEFSQAEKQAALEEAELIKSYGSEVEAAYEAYMNGEQMGYYSPLGVTVPVDFEWSRYAEIMEHSKIMPVVEGNGMADIYMENLPVGTYLTMEHVREFTPQLVSLINSNEEIGTQRNCQIVHVTPWEVCRSCYIAATCLGCCGGGCLTIVTRKDWCRHISTTCSCYTERVSTGC